VGYYAVKEIYPWLRAIRDPLGAYCYLAIGAERALLFDTVHGVGSLPDAIREITDKPVTAVLSHGHYDHSNGACQFEEAWLREADFDLCRTHATEKFRRSALKKLASSGRALPEGFDEGAYVGAGAGNLRKMEPGHVFDLGGLCMEVVGMEGHTAGSAGLLAREHRALLVGDAANARAWLFLQESLPLNRYAEMLERAALLDFDEYFIGHSDAPNPKSDFKKYANVARNASLEKSKPHPVFPWMESYLYEEGGAGVLFSRDKL